MAISSATSLDYLIPDLRMHLGDYTEPYTNSTEYLRHALVMACKTLMKKWHNRYIIDSDYNVKRNAGVTFAIAEPPVIQYADERAFILQASISVKSATLHDTAWDIGSWRDDEVSYSNIAGSGGCAGGYSPGAS